MFGGIRLAIGSLFVVPFYLGVRVTVNVEANPSIGVALMPSGAVIRMALSEAQAGGTKRSRRRDRHEAAALEAERKRLEEREKELLGTKTPELGATCAYDSYASAVSSSEIYTCNGNYYEKYEENGVSGYVGHPIGMDREEIKRAMARHAAAEKKNQEEAEKKLKENTKNFLSSDCAYDSYASFAAASNVYDCGGVQFHEVRENGATSYVRGTAGATKGSRAGAQEAVAKGDNKGRPAAGEKSPPQRANLPQGCDFDTYASFFTSSNVYNCNGTRYRQVQKNGVAVYEILEL